MASELAIRYTTGANLYAIVMNSTHQIWNGLSFAAIDADLWGDCDIALVEQDGTGIYVGDMPAVDAGIYSIMFLIRAGASPAITDQDVGGGAIQWDGESEAVVPTKAEFEARTIPAADYAQHDVDDIKTALEADGTKLDHIWEMTEDNNGTRRLSADAVANVLTVLDDSLDGIIEAIATSEAAIRGAEDDTLLTLKNGLSGGVTVNQILLNSEGDTINSEGD